MRWVTAGALLLQTIQVWARNALAFSAVAGLLGLAPDAGTAVGPIGIAGAEPVDGVVPSDHYAVVADLRY